MKHLVFGTGLIGGFLAGGLISAGIDTVLLGREKHRRTMKNGLTLTDLNGTELKLKPPCFWDVKNDVQFDVIWLTVKGSSVASSLEQLNSLVSDNTIIICCQNGFGSDRTIRPELPTHTILNAIVGFNVAEPAAAHLHRSTDGSLVVEAHPMINSAVALINSPLLPAHTSTNIQAERWAKLQLNLANPVNALSDLPTKSMTEDPDFRKVIAVLMRELLLVTEKMKLDLPKLTALPAKLLPSVLSLPNWLYLRLAQKTLAIDPSARASMWWDLSQGKVSEIAYLNQAVVDQGMSLGVDCRYNQRLVQLIREVEQGTIKIGMTGIELQNRLGIK